MQSSALVQQSTPSTSVAQRDAGHIERKASDATARSGTSGQTATPSSAIHTPQQSVKPSPRTIATSTSTPGKWEHPRMQEIIARQRSTTFDQSNATRFLRSLAGLAVVIFLPRQLADWLPKWSFQMIPAQLVWASYLVQLFLVYEMATSIMPLMRKQDAMEDIPLTPRQRQLLDLPPMSRPATPQEQASYVTPPRYSRNVTPNSMDSLLVNVRDTPLSSSRNSPLGSSLAPSGAGGRGNNVASFAMSGGNRRISDMSLRRESFGTSRSSPQALNELEGAGQSTKSTRSSMGVSSKWLYDKGKDSPGSPAFLGTGWGTGSVFN